MPSAIFSEMSRSRSRVSLLFLKPCASRASSRRSRSRSLGAKCKCGHAGVRRAPGWRAGHKAAQGTPGPVVAASAMPESTLRSQAGHWSNASATPHHSTTWPTCAAPPESPRACAAPPAPPATRAPAPPPAPRPARRGRPAAAPRGRHQTRRPCRQGRGRRRGQPPPRAPRWRPTPAGLQGWEAGACDAVRWKQAGVAISCAVGRLH